MNTISKTVSLTLSLILLYAMAYPVMANETISKEESTSRLTADPGLIKTVTNSHNTRSMRPNQQEGPTAVEFFIFILDISAIDAARQNFTANVFVRLTWNDPRLALDIDDGSVRRMPMEKIWNPEIILANRQGIVARALPEVAQVSADGTVTYRQRLTGILSQPLNLANFPMDSHTFSIHFASASYNSEELLFVPGNMKDDESVIGGSMAIDLSVPDWQILNHEAVSQAYEPIPIVSNAGFAINFMAKRYVIYFYWQILLPLMVVVAMSWTAFWIQHSQPGVRVAVSTSSILTLIAHRFIVASLLPRLPYMTRIDYFSVGSTLLVFIALILVVTATYLHANNREVLANNIDRLARISFPLVFILLFAWFILGA